jgi:hypothetical protein
MARACGDFVAAPVLVAALDDLSLTEIACGHAL